MLSARSSILGVLILTAFLTGCTQKPTFDTPAVIIDHPAEQTETSAVLHIFSSLSASPETQVPKPPSLLITVPFASQAPLGVWDALHEEACEEMALIMVHHYLSHTPLSPDVAESEVQALVTWERAHGYGDDVSAKELGEIALAYYGYRYRLLTDVSEDNLRVELSVGNPVILPEAGRLLKNPYFSGAGPFYHMLVIIGFTKDGFITNDSGTKRGERYFYPTDILMNATHDWTGIKEDIEKGAKTALVIER